MRDLFKLSAATLGVVGLALFVCGLSTDDPELERDLYAGACLTMMFAASAMILAAVRVFIDEAVGRHLTAGRVILATTIAQALADELEDRNGDGPDGQYRVPDLRIVANS